MSCNLPEIEKKSMAINQVMNEVDAILGEMLNELRNGNCCESENPTR